MRRRLATSIVLVVAGHLATPPSALAQWFWQTPLPAAGLEMNDLDCVGQTCLSVAWDGYILRTRDGGVTWSTIVESGDWGDIWALYGMRLVDADTAVVVGLTQSFSGLIARTEDGGDTWTVQSDFTFLLVDVAFFDADHGTAVGADLAGQPAILTTADGGDTWVRQTNGVPSPGDSTSTLFGVEYADAETIFAVGGLIPEGAVVLRSTDGGSSWTTQVLDPDALELEGFHDLAFPEPSTGYVVGERGTILKTTDGGETWVHQSSAEPWKLLAVACGDADTCVAVGLENGDVGDGVALHTTDGGSTWIRDPLDGIEGLKAVAAVDGTAVLATGISIANPTPVLRSLDGGGTWTNLSQSDADRVLKAVDWIDENTGIAVGGNILGDPIQALGCSAAPAPGAGGLILETSDGGSTWREEDPGFEPSPLLDVQFLDSETGVVVGCAGTILRTTDGGDTWTAQTSGFPEQRLQGVSFANSGVGVVVGGRHVDFEGDFPVVLTTTDGGATWLDRTPAEPAQYLLRDVQLVDASTGWAVGGTFETGKSSLIFKTSDGGETWTPQLTAPGPILEAVAFPTADTGIAVGPAAFGSPKILRTTDAGATWNDVTPTDLPPSTRLNDVVFADPLNGLVVGWNGVTSASLVLRTTDGGQSWTPEQGFPKNAGNVFGVDSTDPETATVVTGVPGGWVTDGGMVRNYGGILRTIGSPTFLLGLDPDGITACVPENGAEETSVVVGVYGAGDYSGTVTLSTESEPPGVTSELDPELVEPTRSSAWTLTVDPTAAAGHHVLTLRGEDGTRQRHADLALTLVDRAAAATLLQPANGATDVDLSPTFTWEPIADADAYRIQVATDLEFGNLVIDTETAEAGFIPEAALTPGIYFWRVRGNVAGDRGCALAWSEVFSFTTENQPKVSLAPQALAFEVPVGGGDATTLQVDNLGTAPLVWEVQTAPLPGLRPVTPAGRVVDCEDAVGLIRHDDGTVENGYSASPSTVTQVVYVDRFTPSHYPASFGTVCLAFLSQGSTSLDLEVVIFDDDGPEGGPSTELGAMPVSIDGIPVLPPIPPEPAWFGIDISSLGLVVDSGSVYIGVRYTPSSPNVFLSVDESPGRPAGFAGGYTWNDVIGTWRPIHEVLPQYRSMFVRAVEVPAGCHESGAVPWLSVSPNAGNTPADGSTPMLVTVEATGVEVGEHSATLCVSSNDPVRPLVGVPVGLTVVGAALTPDPQSLDFGDVFVNTTGEPRFVGLHNGGNLDATGLDLQVAGGAFAIDSSTCGPTLGVGETCQVGIAFAPAEAGPAAGTLGISSDTGLPVVVALTGNGVRETGVFTPMGLEVDTEPIISDANGVFEPGELAPVSPIWRHDGIAPQDVSGTASNLTGPQGPTYSLVTAEADYGHLEPGATAGCLGSEQCYEMDIGPSGVERPALHWDAVFDETLSDDTSHTWTLHVGGSFADVPRESPFYGSIETLLHNGVTDGCASTEYCPSGPNTRGQMPVFVLKALEGPGYRPPACDENTRRFADVPIGSPFCPWIQELAERGVIAGCGGVNYCPDHPVTRAQMSIFLLKTLEGADYTPPACTGRFADVACRSPFAAWIEELARRGVTAGCSESEYCPTDPVTRAQMAVFLVRTFGLTLYGP